MRVVTGVHVVSSDHVGNTEIGNLYRSACVECSSRREDDNYLDPNPALHPRRTLVAATAPRALSAAAVTVTARAAALKPLSLYSGEQCAFDSWTHSGGMWAGDSHGFASRSSLCL